MLSFFSHEDRIASETKDEREERKGRERGGCEIDRKHIYDTIEFEVKSKDNV